MVAIIAFSATTNAKASWHTHCFTPKPLNMLSATGFPELADLSVVGRGHIQSVSPHLMTSWPAWSDIEVFAHRSKEASDSILYFKDALTDCVARIDLRNPLATRKSSRFELVHQRGSECEGQGKLSSATLVELNPCRMPPCQKIDNDLILFLGPDEYDGVTFADVMLFGGEIELDLENKPWRTSALEQNDVEWVPTNRTNSKDE